MATFNARFHGEDPLVYENVSGAVVLGAKLAIPNVTATSDPSLQGFGVAGDAAKNCIGVTEHDTVPVSLRSGFENGSESWDASYLVTDTSVPGATTTIYNDVVGYVTYTAACANGAKLACAAGGAVRPWVVGDGPDAVVGSCVQPGGVAAAGVALGRIRVP